MKKIKDRVDYLEKRVDDLENIMIRVKSGELEIERSIRTHNLIRMIINYLGITIKDKEYYTIAKKDK